MMLRRSIVADMIFASLGFILLVIGCGGDRNWSHPCDPTYGTMIPVTMDMVALDTDCRISTESGPADISGSYLYCGKSPQNGWCASFLDFKVDSMYNLQRGIDGELPDKIIKATLDLSVICKGGGKVDVFPWLDRGTIPSPSDIEVPSDSWWKLASFSDDGTVERKITLNLSTELLDWLMNDSASSFAGIILFPRGSTRGPEWSEGYWIISTLETPHLQVIAARSRD